MLAPYRGVAQVLGRRIRRRLLWVFLSFGIGAASTWYLREEVFTFLLAPAGGKLSPFNGLPVYTSPTTMMGATIQLSIKGGVLAAFPVFVVSLYTLLSPIIAPPQRKFIKIFLPATVLCFFAGGTFAYFVMLPTGLKFLLSFGDGVAVPLINLTEYVSLLLSMMFWLGVVFELPVAMFLLTKLRVVSYLRLRRVRKFVPVMAFILSAILTPTFDMINQTLLAVPIIVLYEVGLFLSWLARPDEGDYWYIKKVWRTLTLPYRKLR